MIFANAVFQWIPDHSGLMVGLMEHLAPGGALAVQMPDNLGEPLHVIMRETAADMPFADRLAGAAREKLPPAEDYYDRLAPHASRLDIWHTIYNHPMEDAEAIVEWIRSTGLRPFLAPLSPEEQDDFLAEYTARLRLAYQPRADGRVLLRFPRLFVVAVR